MLIKISVKCESRNKLNILIWRTVCPSAEEAPPLKVDGGDKDDYILRSEKNVKLGSFRKKIGRLAAEAAQPKSLQLHSIRSDQTCPVTTKTTVNLRFDPADGERLASGISGFVVADQNTNRKSGAS